MLVVSRDTHLRCLFGSDTIKSSEWTTASSLLPGAASLAPIVVDFTLLHIQPNFLRCSPPGTSLFHLYSTSKHVKFPASHCSKEN